MSHYESLNMVNLRRLAIIGSGPTALYLLKHIADAANHLASHIDRIEIFEKDIELGRGMPYSPRTTDQYNLCNIASKELPPLETPFADWLRQLDDDTLLSYGMRPGEISEDETYSRLAMGHYFADQFQAQLHKLRTAGVRIVEHANCRVADINDQIDAESVTVVVDNGSEYEFDAVVIASGHSFDDRDQPQAGYYASPWPIQKLLPNSNEQWNFTIGTLGASLSAFDVISSLAHRHGRFDDGDTMKYRANPGSGEFRFVMHAAKGWLPHLQYEQTESFRVLYRHVRADVLEHLRDENGFLRLDTYFDQVCRPSLIKAFSSDGRDDIVEQLKASDFGIESFAKTMTDEHEYADAFEGMRCEFPEAKESVEQDRPIHWKEIFDDLMYTLNFHAHWMPAEDHIRFQSVVMPFLLNVIAAMPLQSARMLLALRDAGRLELVAGRATVVCCENGETTVDVEEGNKTTTHTYRMFVDCTGQGSLKLDEFPFASLVRSGSVRPARAEFARSDSVKELSDCDRERLVDTDPPAYEIGGIDIDPSYRIIDVDGQPNDRLYDVAFPHATGVRPYSYGLQVCELTARMVVDYWKVNLPDATLSRQAKEIHH
ncbi:hypothetical protein Pla22_52020 [Rubripirellula amarantea]|uniref:FAD-dependent urate hydroxylase HpyO/Asp monooxygenase CreE-like FAD/NAD(P)-binding domain-containing protein n=1 Tax=Rubripirellula amarantea TaxID=2527999 RepID=A0A5C5WAI8_9BACT|nr:FAD/NAD(P)-binding protein [Rubripirellula amarantea]TWT47926.1 hypothetical protein Pla22_52020 [Rubripirellula amarantea]